MKSEKVRVRGKRVGYVISGLRSLNDASTASSSSVVYCGVCVCVCGEGGGGMERDSVY